MERQRFPLAGGPRGDAADPNPARVLVVDVLIRLAGCGERLAATGTRSK
jgi:hypothetical protein